MTWFEAIQFSIDKILLVAHEGAGPHSGLSWLDSRVVARQPRYRSLVTHDHSVLSLHESLHRQDVCGFRQRIVRFQTTIVQLVGGNSSFSVTTDGYRLRLLGTCSRPGLSVLQRASPAKRASPCSAPDSLPPRQPPSTSTVQYSFRARAPTPQHSLPPRQQSSTSTAQYRFRTRAPTI